MNREHITHYKHLSIMLDHKLRWDAWTDFVSKRMQQRMCFIKTYLSFNAHSRMSLMFYRALIESVMIFCVICWYGNASKVHRRSVGKVVTIACKLFGLQLQSIENIYKERVLSKANIIVNDKRHPLSYAFEILTSGWWYYMPRCMKNRPKLSFMPQAIKFLNSSSSSVNWWLAGLVNYI